MYQVRRQFSINKKDKHKIRILLSSDLSSDNIANDWGVFVFSDVFHKQHDKNRILKKLLNDFKHSVFMPILKSCDKLENIRRDAKSPGNQVMFSDLKVLADHEIDAYNKSNVNPITFESDHNTFIYRGSIKCNSCVSLGGLSYRQVVLLTLLNTFRVSSLNAIAEQDYAVSRGSVDNTIDLLSIKLRQLESSINTNFEKLMDYRLEQTANSSTFFNQDITRNDVWFFVDKVCRIRYGDSALDLNFTSGLTEAFRGKICDI
jgi:hypothetical protein